MIRYAIGMFLIKIAALLKPDERRYRPVRNPDGTWRFEEVDLTQKTNLGEDDGS